MKAVGWRATFTVPYRGSKGSVLARTQKECRELIENENSPDPRALPGEYVRDLKWERVYVKGGDDNG